MKKFLEQKYVPVTLLCLYLLKCLIVRPNISEAIILLVVAALFAFKYFLDFQTKPDPSAEILNKLGKFEVENKQIKATIERSIEDINSKLATMTVTNKGQMSKDAVTKSTFNWG